MEMKKYRHKQTGETATICNPDDTFYQVNSAEVIPARLVENSQDWELIEDKPDYEVIKLKLSAGHTRTRSNDPTAKHFEGLEGSFDWILEKFPNSIYSVKRLNDGEIFTVGDKVLYYGKNTKIKSIYYNEHSQLSFKVEGDSAPLTGVFSNKMHLKKLTIPLLTTYDGVPIYEGDSFYEVTETFQIYSVCPSAIHIFLKYKNYRKAFSTEEAAQEYVEENKPEPLFFTNDGVPIYKSDGYWVLHIEYNDGLSLHKPFEIWKASGDKLNLTNPYIKRFSTEQAAKDYVNLHKPKLSKMEIQNKLQVFIAVSNFRDVPMSELIDAFNYKDE